MTLANDLWKLAAEASRDIAHRSRERWTMRDALHTAEDVETVERVRRGREATRALNVIRAGGSVMFVKELAKICGKAGAAGAVVDGAVGGVQAAKYVQRGAIDKEQALKHVGAEAGCGFVTSSSGTAGTLAVFMVTGSMGPAALAAGMGASMGSRYLYKEAVGETLPTEEEIERMEREETGQQTEESPVEDIGPDAEASSTPDLEDIGPFSPGGSEAEADSAEEGADGAGSSTESSSEEEGPNGAGDVWESIGPDED